MAWQGKPRPDRGARCNTSQPRPNGLLGDVQNAIERHADSMRASVSTPVHSTDKATSELLPPDNDETLLLSLQLSDLIRSKSIEAPLALKSLRRRLSHKNPNVQIQSLHVLDVLVKNSGEALLLAVANGKDGWLGQVEELCRSVSEASGSCV